jgi:hypothetical protein
MVRKIRSNWCGDIRLLLPNPLTKVEFPPTPAQNSTNDTNSTKPDPKPAQNTSPRPGT